MLFDRRTFLISSAALAGCATQARAEDGAFRNLSDTLTTLDPEARWQAIARVNVGALGPEDRILHAAIAPGAEAEAAIARLGYAPSPYAVTHRNGLYRSASADAAAIARETERLNADAARGVIAPDFVLDAAIPLVEAASRASEGARGEALAAQTQALRALRSRASADPSARSLPNGADYYRAALQFQLGAAVDPHAAHADALSRVAAVTTEAASLLAQIGVRHTSAAEGLRALIHAERRTSVEAWRAAALEDMRAVLARAPALIAPAFTAAPPTAEIIALPASEEAAGTRGRREGNAYIVDLGGLRTRWSLASVVYHETIPGHLLQAPFDSAAPALQRRYASGYSEGWATYAEMLADELGGFAHDPLTRLGYLHWMLFRLARVVGDTGMHALGWDRARTIAEMRAIQGESIAFVSIEEDVGRMAAQPGAAAAQGLAALHIADARTRATSLPAFHDAVLRRGPIAPGAMAQAIATT